MHKLVFYFTCTTGASGISVGRYSLEEMGTLFMTQLPQFQGTNPVAGCIRPWVISVGSGCHFPARSCQLHCSVSGALPASTRLHSDVGGRSAEGDVKPHICGSVLSNGFSNNQYRSLRMGSCLSSFEICKGRILLLGGPQEKGGLVSMCVAFFVWWWWFVECCHITCTTSFSVPLGSTSLCTGYPGSLVFSSPLVCPVSVAPWPFMVMSTRLCLWVPSLSFFCSISFVHLQMSQCE